MWGYRDPRPPTKKHRIRPRPVFEFVRNMNTGEVFRVGPSGLQRVIIQPVRGYVLDAVGIQEANSTSWRTQL